MIIFRNLIVYIIFFVAISSIASGRTVKVGGYVFPPFVVRSESGKYTGLTIDLINALNSIQGKCITLKKNRRDESYFSNFDKKNNGWYPWVSL